MSESGGHTSNRHGSRRMAIQRDGAWNAIVNKIANVVDVVGHCISVTAVGVAVSTKVDQQNLMSKRKCIDNR